MRRPLHAAGLAALGLILPVLVAAPARAQQVQRLTLEGQRIEIFNVAGRATLHRGTGSTVVVQAARVGADAGQLQFATDAAGRDGAARLRVVYPLDRAGDGIYWQDGGTGNLRLRADGTFGGSGREQGDRITVGSRGSFRASADLDIAVPEGRTVTLHLAVGRVELNGTSGDFTIDTWSADVGAQDIAGDYLFDTGSGDVTVRGANGSLRLDTGSGDCTVAGVRGTLLDIDTGSGDADATDVRVDRARFDTGSGDVRARGVQAANGVVDTGSGDAVLEFTGGTIDDWRIDTGSGDATVTLPPQADVTISIDTGGGDMTVDRDGLTLQHREHDAMILRAGSGRGRLLIDTGSGDVRIR
jgi:hypothetical protein